MNVYEHCRHHRCQPTRSTSCWQRWLLLSVPWRRNAEFLLRPMTSVGSPSGRPEWCDSFCLVVWNMILFYFIFHMGMAQSYWPPTIDGVLVDITIYVGSFLCPFLSHSHILGILWNNPPNWLIFLRWVETTNSDYWDRKAIHVILEKGNLKAREDDT